MRKGFALERSESLEGAKGKSYNREFSATGDNFEVRGPRLLMRKWIERAKQSLEGPFQEIVRVLKIARKPEKEEFTLMLKVCSLGLVVLGIYGFIILYLFFVFLVH